MAAAAAGQVEVIDSRRLGGAWVLGQLWERLEIGRAIRKVAAGRRLDGEAAERVIFALVAQRALEPGSKLAATRGVAQRVAVEGCAGFSEDAAYAAMDFLLAALDEIASQIFGSVAHLLNLDLDIVFAGGVDGFVVADPFVQAVPEDFEPAVAQFARRGLVAVAGCGFRRRTPVPRRIAGG